MNFAAFCINAERRSRIGRTQYVRARAVHKSASGRVALKQKRRASRISGASRNSACHGSACSVGPSSERESPSGLCAPGAAAASRALPASSSSSQAEQVSQSVGRSVRVSQSASAAHSHHVQPRDLGGGHHLGPLAPQPQAPFQIESTHPGAGEAQEKVDQQGQHLVGLDSQHHQTVHAQLGPHFHW